MNQSNFDVTSFMGPIAPVLNLPAVNVSATGALSDTESAQEAALINERDVPESDVLENIDLSIVKLDPVWSRVLPVSGARRFRVLGLCKVNGEVVVATSYHNIASVRNFVASRIKEPFRLVRADEKELLVRLAGINPPTTRANASEAHGETCEVVQACDELFRAANLRGASDIHLVPTEDFLQSKFRVDGVLEDYHRFSSDLQLGLISRIKVLSGLNIAEKRKPQDGRFSLKQSSSMKPTDVRVATIPTRFGERVTMRLLTPMQGKPSLAKLGMNSIELEKFSGAINSSNGLILLTGPTGCGKSTTLYTAITQLLESRGGNVITIEDPVEYEIPGASQVEVDSAEKVSFSRALRSILRHDPDVIMLGEIRDAETAELAIKASLTGHLVFSTLHTNTAAGVVTRLIDMGVEPFLIAATLRLALAQRLVRQLCPRCRVATPLSSTDAMALGKPQLAGRPAYEAAGCVYCAGKGFIGRTGLFEMLQGGTKVSQMITRKASESELLEQMQQSDHSRLIDDGIAKILNGTTTAKQVLSAVAMW